MWNCGIMELRKCLPAVASAQVDGEGGWDYGIMELWNYGIAEMRNCLPAVASAKVGGNAVLAGSRVPCDRFCS